MQIDQTKIEEAIVKQAVREFANNDELYERVKSGVNVRIDALFKDRVEAMISDKINEIVSDGFDREYSKVDSFGRPSGPKTTISAELEKLVSSYWSDRVDRNGKKSDSSYSTTSRAEWMMAQVCADDFSKEMKQHVVNVTASLKDHFRGVLHNHINLMLSDVFHVKSVDDQNLAKQSKDIGSAIIRPDAKQIGAS